MTGRVALAGLLNVEITVAVASMPVEPGTVDFVTGTTARPSGVACNAAAAYAALGRPFRWTAVAGTDAMGAATRAFALGLPGGDLRFVDVPHAPLTVVLSDPSGATAVFTDPKGAVDRPLDVDLSDCVAVQPTNIRPNHRTVERASDAGLPVFVDLQGATGIDEPHNAPFCAVARAVAVSHRNLDAPPEQWAAAFVRRWGTEMVVIGLGADGALLHLRAGVTRHVPAVQGPVSSTVGAGDALWAAFVDGYLDGLDPVAATHRAVRFAGLKIATAGGAVGHPSREQLDRS